MLNKIGLITQTIIENRIFTIRETQVMIDNDLAELYDVGTKVLNQAVKRNISRFPEMFRFRLTIQEKMNWSQIVTGSGASLKDLGKKWFAFSRMDITFMDKLKLKK